MVRAALVQSGPIENVMIEFMWSISRKMFGSTHVSIIFGIHLIDVGGFLLVLIGHILNHLLLYTNVPLTRLLAIRWSFDAVAFYCVVRVYVCFEADIIRIIHI